MVSLYVILITKLDSPQGFISQTCGIKANGGVQQGDKVCRVPFTVEAGTRCVYLEPTRMRIE